MQGRPCELDGLQRVPVPGSCGSGLKFEVLPWVWVPVVSPTPAWLLPGPSNVVHVTVPCTFVPLLGNGAACAIGAATTVSANVTALTELKASSRTTGQEPRGSTVPAARRVHRTLREWRTSRHTAMPAVSTVRGSRYGAPTSCKVRNSVASSARSPRIRSVSYIRAFAIAHAAFSASNDATLSS